MPRKISKHVIERLEVHERTPSGRARNYVDPVTGELFTQRERQQARTGLSIEAQREIKRSGNAAALERATRRSESAGYLADKYRARLAAAGDKRTRTEVFRDRGFWREVDKLKRDDGKRRIKALVSLGVMSASYAATILALYVDDDDPGGSDDFDDFDF